MSKQNVIPAKAGPPHNQAGRPPGSVEDGIQEVKSLDPGLRRGDGVLSPEIAAPLSRTWTEAEAFAYCSELTHSHYENFPVGSILVPRALQPAVHSLYAFMRTADDFSDEGRRPGDEQERLDYLDTWGQMLTDCEQGRAAHPVFVALRVTLQQYQLPVQWLHDLLTAFRMDCTIRRYPTYEELLRYCRYSANPVGRLILTLFGYRSDELYQLSDAICTSLQLANHWQDVAIDAQKDRIYLPQEDMQKFGVDENWIRLHPLPEGEAPFSDLMAFQVKRTRELFAQGKPLPGRVQGRLRLELAMTWRGGVRILDKIEAANYDVFNRRPVVTKFDWVRLGLASLLSNGL